MKQETEKLPTKIKPIFERLYSKRMFDDFKREISSRLKSVDSCSDAIKSVKGMVTLEDDGKAWIQCIKYIGQNIDEDLQYTFGLVWDKSSNKWSFYDASISQLSSNGKEYFFDINPYTHKVQEYSVNF